MDRLAFGLNAKSGRVYSSGLGHLAGLGRRWRGGGGSRRIATRAAAAAAVEAKSVSRSKDKRRSTATEPAREGADAAGHAAARSGGRRRQDTQRQFIVKSETSKSSADSGGWEIHNPSRIPKEWRNLCPGRQEVRIEADGGGGEIGVMSPSPSEEEGRRGRRGWWCCCEK